MNYLLAPSFYAHILQSILLLIALIYFYVKYTSFKKLSEYQILVLLLLSAGVVGIHGLTHSELEKVYKLTF